MQQAIDDHRPGPFLAELRTAFDTALRAMEAASGPGTAIRVKAFSDNIVFALRIANDGEDEMLRIVKAVGGFQCALVLSGTFVRGAVAVGDHYMDNEIIFGEALLEAYETERQKTLNPRVILTPSARSSLAKHLGKYEEDRALAPQCDILLVDSDNSYFVNYLAGLEGLTNDERLEQAKRHKRQIEAALRTFVEQPHVRNKYVWVARFHNYLCVKWILDCRIEDAVIDAGPRRLQDL